MNHFDFVIIGGGAAAFAAAIRANELGAKTALINAGLPLGGTCVNVGCVPSKTLLWAGEVMHLASNHGIPGIALEVKRFDFAKVVRDELALVARLREEKYRTVLAQLEHVTPVEGKATFTSPHEVAVNGERLTAEKFIIAVGSTASIPPIAGIREVGCITHIEALALEQQPKELIVVGAGPLGLEFGQMFARFGTKVTILQRGPSILPRAEPELTNRLAEVLTKEGITIRTNVAVQRAQSENGKKILSYTIEGRAEQTAGDEILLAAGKTPNTKDLELAAAGVAIDHTQAVVVNPSFQTSQPHIFAVGDVTNAPLRLETTAGHEGTLAAENALTDAHQTIDYATVPWAVFTDPQLAGVGFTENEQMKTLGVCACPVRDNPKTIYTGKEGASDALCVLRGANGEKISNGACRTVSFTNVPKAIIMRRTEGLIKMAIHPATRQIMGVHILAPNASELIATAMMLVKNKNTIDDVTNSLPMFPTLAEAIKLAALSFTKDIRKLSCCI